MNLDQLMKERSVHLVGFLEGHFASRESFPLGHERLMQSVRYSVLQEGGKRFRPVLAMLSAEALGVSLDRALPFAAAVECVHTYSLIHDDLPAMDNDDMRRGLPTNHRKFDEATAILAGDALLTEAFQLVADHYAGQPVVAIRLVSALARAAGMRGMVGGQAIDMASKKDSISLSDLRLMHELKTGALIEVSAVGAAIASEASDKQTAALSKYASQLGLAFQVADDLLDYDPSKLEPGSYPALLGPEKTREFLDELTEGCLRVLSDWSSRAEPLREIVRYNRSRTV